MDQCEHSYSFRIAVAKSEELERMALEFNQKPYALNAFPVTSEYRECVEKEIVIDNPNVTLAACKKSCDGPRYLLRLLNNQEKPAKATLCIDDKKICLEFGKYEVKTVALTDMLCECKQLEI